jgi:hypothetical protein
MDLRDLLHALLVELVEAGIGVVRNDVFNLVAPARDGGSCRLSTLIERRAELVAVNLPMQSALCLVIDKGGFLGSVILDNVSAKVKKNVLSGGTHHRGCGGLIPNMLIVVISC